MASDHDNPTEGLLPADLARVLRDQSIVVPQDQAVFEKVAEWMNAPSNTASADLPHVKPPTASPIEIARERAPMKERCPYCNGVGLTGERDEWGIGKACPGCYGTGTL